MDQDIKDWMDVARIGYTAYGQHAGLATYDGKPMPRWDELPDHVKEKWSVAVRAVVMELLNRINGMLDLFGALALHPFRVQLLANLTKKEGLL